MLEKISEISDTINEITERVVKNNYSIKITSCGRPLLKISKDTNSILLSLLGVKYLSINEVELVKLGLILRKLL